MNHPSTGTTLPALRYKMMTHVARWADALGRVGCIQQTRDRWQELHRDYPGWTLVQSAVLGNSGPGCTVYLAHRPGGRSLIAYSIPGLREQMIREA